MVRTIPRYGSQEYWKSAKGYRFDTSDNQYLDVFAHSKKIANMKATNWEKWLIRTNRGNTKVKKNTLRLL